MAGRRLGNGLRRPNGRLNTGWQYSQSVFRCLEFSCLLVTRAVVLSAFDLRFTSSKGMLSMVGEEFSVRAKFLRSIESVCQSYMPIELEKNSSLYDGLFRTGHPNLQVIGQGPLFRHRIALSCRLTAIDTFLGLTLFNVSSLQGMYMASDKQCAEVIVQKCNNRCVVSTQDCLPEESLSHPNSSWDQRHQFVAVIRILFEVVRVRIAVP